MAEKAGIAQNHVVGLSESTFHFVGSILRSEVVERDNLESNPQSSKHRVFRAMFVTRMRFNGYTHTDSSHIYDIVNLSLEIQQEYRRLLSLIPI